MLKTKVIADNILNLTDARYFSAYGVDYLIFNLSNINQESITEIKEWVEGVKILLDFNQSLTPPLFNFILGLSPAGFVSDSKSFLDDLKGQIVDAECFLRTTDGNLTKLSDNGEEQMPFVRANLLSVPIEQIINQKDIEGIIVEGQPEEKVGFKNFDQLDEIFDLLAEEY